MKRLMVFASILGVTACAPIGVTAPVKGDDLKAFKDDDMITFVNKRFVEPKQMGVPAASGSLHATFKNVLFVDFPTRVAAVGPISVTAYRPHDEIKGFCESKGYEFVPSPYRDTKNDDRPWPYVQNVDKQGRQFMANLKQVGLMNAVQGAFQERAKRWGNTQVPVTPNYDRNTAVQYMASTVYRKILPSMVQEGAVGEFDCVKKSKNGDYLYASVAIYPYQFYPSKDADFGRMDIAITVYQSNF